MRRELPAADIRQVLQFFMPQRGRCLLLEQTPFDSLRFRTLFSCRSSKLNGECRAKRFALRGRLTTMRSLLLLSALFSCAGAFGQQLPIIPEDASGPVRIPIRHADPWFIKFFLEGQQLRSPEISTIMLIGGAPPGATQGIQQGASALFSGGKLLVNPTDNSLWFIPDKK